MKTKILGIIISLSFTTLLACPKVTPPAPKPTPVPSEQPKPTTPPVDSEVDNKYIEGLEPEPKAKMKYTYTHVFKDPSGKEIDKTDFTTEILEVLEDSIRIRTSFSPSGEAPRDYLVKRPAVLLIDYAKPDKPAKFKVVANETVKVPAGEFKNSIKIQLTDDKKIKYTNWLVPGTGVVKYSKESTPPPATGNLFSELKAIK